MATRIYFVPIEGTETKEDPRAPKYCDTIMADVMYSMTDYGNESWCVVGYHNASPAQHSALIAETDVISLPENLDQQIGGARNTVESVLEAHNVPGDWVTANMTYRTALRYLRILFAVVQRAQGLQLGRIFGSGITLDTMWTELPTVAQNRLTIIADSFGFDKSGLTGASNVRQIMKALADQWPAVPLVIGGVEV